MNATLRLLGSPVAPLLAAAFLAAPIPAQTSADARLDATVASADGTTIAYERAGAGPAVVLVGGALSDRGDSARLAALLARDFTVVSFDRRGRGKSGDTRPYAVKREIEDVEALVDAAGGAAFLFGSSSGAVLALEAATALPGKVRGAALFEPPFLVDDSRPPIAADLFERISAELAAERRGDAVALFMVEGVGVPAELLAGMRGSPMWAVLEQRAHTLPYDGALLAGLTAGKPLPPERWSALEAPVLVLDGGASDASLRNAARALVEVLPAAEPLTLDGLDHSAATSAPEKLAPVLSDYFGTLQEQR
jgi:pimeloyl-ACP methyl ester carboxylesterase